jgi:hypothetical protein
MSNNALFPEPVPAASQFAIMPFLSAIEGLLDDRTNVPGLRVTMHRVMSREGDGFLQQACAYLPIKSPNWRSKVGRIFPVTEGIIGKAYKTSAVWRTPHFATEQAFKAELAAAKAEVGDDPSKVGFSWLAIPFLGPSNEVVLILFAECEEFNFFADDARVQQIVGMCRGYCRLFDELQSDPYPNLRNFPLERGTPVIAKETVYRFQEQLSIRPPKFNSIYSFNYEASVA